MRHGYLEDTDATARYFKASDAEGEGVYGRFLTALGFEGDDGWRWLADNVILSARHARALGRLTRVSGQPVERQRQLEVETMVMAGVTLVLYAFELRAKGTPLGDL